MADQTRADIIKGHPFGTGLDDVRTSFHSICAVNNISRVEHLGQEDLRELVLDLLRRLQNHARLVRSSGHGRRLFGDLSWLNLVVESDDAVDLGRMEPLLNAAVAEHLDDSLVWKSVYEVIPQSYPLAILQTPSTQDTSSLENSSELCQNTDPILKAELERLYVGLPDFHKAFFGGRDLGIASEAVFRKCTDNLLFEGGWRGWPAAAKESDVLAWLGGLIPKLDAFADDSISIPPVGRRLLAQSRTLLDGSISKRGMDIGFVKHDVSHYKSESEHSKYRWSHILVVGELKSNPAADTASIAWQDIARYAREVFAAQENRRFVLGFTLCGSLMRLWEFDRLGGLASEQFDINTKDGGLQFVKAILGFLRMNEQMLGFDPTIITCGRQQHIDIKLNDRTESLVVDGVITRECCIAGRATICWKAHRKDDPQASLVIKDSWQYTDRDEEGEFLKEATQARIVNVARYYHHETVRSCGADDDVESNIRKKLDVTKATNYPTGSVSSAAGSGRGNGAGVKRPLSKSDAASPPRKRFKRPSCQIDAALLPSPRSSSASLVEASVKALPNRVHRRLVLQDYGEPIYKASSRVALLVALEGCIRGHRSLHEAGLLHRDISANNLMINEGEEDPKRRGFLIDLDLAIRHQRPGASGAKGKIGTRAFMAIGALMGNEQHTFMHDLESFFWVLFWICIHYDGPGEYVGPTRFDTWNHVEEMELATGKTGLVVEEEDFLETCEKHFTPYYRPLLPWVNRLRRRVFPDGRRWKRQEVRLYDRMMEVLRRAQGDPEVIGR
ncbi:serine/threonine-protein kinase Sgk2 [Ophiocordyceps sinensis CO18]|uniref:non-specific serine/threonine protein kinase n=1 Tax=Ophiocordyceps sinensis (strain Co18 / CGMCC 3.14243) TaxID=911162 RepID=T5A9M0_OPHSC|nr:serine/threonine-protein kinase Sgk2 [Ophiocordyceps sinensis CO18]